MERRKEYYMGEGGDFSRDRAVVSLVSPELPVACPGTKGVLESELTNLLVGWMQGVLNACANMEAIKEGKHVHEQIIENEWDLDACVGSSLVDMYTKCGRMEDVQRVFNKMSSQDVMTWTAMILGHVKSRQGQKALQLFHRMQQEDA
jgi:pentatricopeptide repeat protein